MSPGAVTRLSEILVGDEGEVLHAYKDSKGFLTLGVGRLIDKRRGGGISQVESRYLLRNDIARVCAEMEKHFPWALDMSDNRQIVLASMLFQMGLANVLEFKNTLAAMRTGRYLAAARGMRRSKWAREDSPTRAERLATLMEQG